MSQIPDDIDRIATDLVRADYSGDHDPEWAMYLAIAKALNSERERCAAIEPEPDIAESTLGKDGYADGYVVGFYDCQVRFANACRSPAKPPTASSSAG